MLSATNKDAADIKSADATRRDAWNKVADAKDDLEATAHKAGRKVRDYIDTASDEFSEVADTVKSHVRSNPLQSSLIALAVGFVIGRLFRL